MSDLGLLTGAEGVHWQIFALHIVQLPEDRVCKVTRECTTDKRVENEYQYLFNCNAYTAMRGQWPERATLGNDFQQLSDVEKMH